MIVSANIPDELVQAIDLHISEHRVSIARKGIIGKDEAFTRSSFIREAVDQFLRSFKKTR